MARSRRVWKSFGILLGLGLQLADRAGGLGRLGEIELRLHGDDVGVALVLGRHLGEHRPGLLGLALVGVAAREAASAGRLSGATSSTSL